MSSAPSSSKAPTATYHQLPPCGFMVKGGKKGNIPIALEKRPKGKKVTIISNVQGSAKSLLTALSTLLGCGGTTRQEASGQHWTIEVQGDQVDRVAAALTQLGCLRGVAKETDEKGKKKAVEVAQISTGYDKFLRGGDKEKEKEKPKYNEDDWICREILASAECTKWHGFWVYCRGRCVQTDLNDVFVECDLSGERAEERPWAEGGPARPETKEQLDLQLKALGLLSEVGTAAAGWGGGRRGGKSQTLNAPVPNALPNGGSALAEYRKAALNPGARLIGEEQAPKELTRRQALKLRTTLAPMRPRPAPPAAPRRMAPPAKTGIFTCAFCSCTFSLGKTLKLHMKNAHGGAQPPRMLDVRRVVGAVVRAPSPVRESMKRPYIPEVPYAQEDPHDFMPPGAAPTTAWSLAEAIPSKPAKKPAAAAKRRAPSQRASERPGGGSQQCPVCSEHFPADGIEAHVSACLDAAQGGSESTDEDEQEPELCRVTVAFAPTAEASDVQLTVRVSEEMVIEWWQPQEEGGYWAYGYVLDNPNVAGYVPMDSLERRGPWRPDEPTSPTSPAAPQAAPGDGSIPDEWLESFLMLELPPSKADEFWRRFEQLNKAMSIDAAWLQALGSVLDEMDWATVEPDPAPPGLAPPPLLAAPPGLAGGSASDSEEEVLYLKPAEELARPEDSAKSAAKGSAKSPAAAKAGVRAAAGGGAADSRKALGAPRDEAEAAPAASEPQQAAAEAPAEQPGDAEGPEVCEVTEPFLPDGTNDTQILLDKGQRVVVEWRQPKEEGGYWAYGGLEAAPDAMGYFPLSCLEAAPATAPPPPATAAKASKAASGGPAAAAAGGFAPAAAAGGYGAADDYSAYFRPQGTGVASLADAFAAAQGGGSKASTGAGGWRKQRNAAASASAAAGGLGAQRAGSRPQRTAAKSQREAARPEPYSELYGEPYGAQSVEQAALDIARRAEAEEWAAEAEAGGADAAAELEDWAHCQLKSLTRRFCMSPLDTEVAFSMLSMCTSAADLRNEAASLIADNAPVKNFASELWRRRAEIRG